MFGIVSKDKHRSAYVMNVATTEKDLPSEIYVPVDDSKNAEEEVVVIEPVKKKKRIPGYALLKKLNKEGGNSKPLKKKKITADDVTDMLQQLGYY